MSGAYHQPLPGYYRLAPGVRIVTQRDSAIAVCDYPLRVVRLSAIAARLLSFCQEERTAAQMAVHLTMPSKRVETLCDQLHWKGLLETGPREPPDEWPSVSIIIPCYNRVRELERCLCSLFKLEYPLHRLEIIVVDDGSTDGTAIMLSPVGKEAISLGIAWRVIHHDRQRGAAAARNSGTIEACYDLIAYIDSDCIASPRWLTELVPAFQDDHIAAVGGMIRAYNGDEQPRVVAPLAGAGNGNGQPDVTIPFASAHTRTLRSLISSTLRRYEDVCSSLFMGIRPQRVCLDGPLTYLPTANLLVRRVLWQQLEGFAPLAFGEDVDFCRRALTSGAQIHYLPYGIVYHDYRATMKGFLRIRASYASAEAALLQCNPASRRVLVLPPEQAAFAGLAIGGAWSLLMRGFPDRRKGKVYLPSFLFPSLALLAALFLALFGVRTRLHRVRAQRVPVSLFAVVKATLRGHLAYTYHLCRHLTRYYTLPLFIVSLLIPLFLPLLIILCSIVICVDYARLRPAMKLSEYTLCTLLDDCAYEVGVVWGCVKHRMWKPLIPMVKRK